MAEAQLDDLGLPQLVRLIVLVLVLPRLFDLPSL